MIFRKSPLGVIFYFHVVNFFEADLKSVSYERAFYRQAFRKF